MTEHERKQADVAEAGAISVEGVRDRIRAMIHDKQLQPGERINEQALAQRLQVGRATAREALRALESTGLVRIVPNRGAEVRRLSLEEALHLYDVRAGFARSTGRLAAARFTAEDEAALLALFARMEAAAAERDAIAYQQGNELFHDAFLCATRNARLIAMSRAVEDELKLYLTKGVFTLAQIRISLSEHRAMLDAVVNGLPEQAAEAFERHVLTGKQRMLETVSNEKPGIAPAKSRKGEHV